MEKETAKIPASLLALVRSISCCASIRQSIFLQLLWDGQESVERAGEPVYAFNLDALQPSDRSNQLAVRSKQPPDARLSLRTSTDGRRFFNVTIAIAAAVFILVEGAMFIWRSNFATAPETKPTAYPSATTRP
jgi:hypothetical protein